MQETDQQTIIKDSFPITLLEKRFKIPGIFSFTLVIEDRRPDLDPEINKEDIRQLGYKYKHIIDIKFLRYSFYAIFRTINSSYIKINNQHQ